MTDNPYASPLSDDKNLDDPASSSTRSRIPKVIGIIGICIAGLGIIGQGFSTVVLVLLQDSQFMHEAGLQDLNLIPSQILGFALLVLSLIANIYLVKGRDLGRRLFNISALATIGAGILISIVTINQLSDYAQGDIEAMVQVISTIVGQAMSMVFPIIGMALLNKPRVIAQLRGEVAPPNH